MKALAANLGLTLQAGKVEMGELLKLGVFPGNDQALYCLGEQILMVEGNKRTLVLERKDYPNSHRMYGYLKKSIPGPAKNIKCGWLKY